MYHELLLSNSVTMICMLHTQVHASPVSLYTHFQSTKVVLVLALAPSSTFLLELMQAVYNVQLLLDEFTYYLLAEVSHISGNNYILLS